MIVNDEQRRAMEFIAAANLGGYRPTGREVNEWRLRPEPKPARRGRLLEPAVPEVPERRVPKNRGPLTGSALSNLFEIRDLGGTDFTALSRLASAHVGAIGLPLSRMLALDQHIVDQVLGIEYETIPGKPGKPAVYAPDKPPEKFLAHLRRLGWIDRDGRRRYGVTLLGYALLRADAIAEAADEDSAVMVLPAEDQKLGYGQVLGRIADSGDALVLDAYLGTEQLMDILEHTNASRFLVGDKLSEGRIAELAVQIRLSPPNNVGSTRELRQASFHDRYLIGEHKVYTLTASLNGVGRSSMAILMEMTEVAARAIRTHAEELWASGQPIASGLSAKALVEGAASSLGGSEAPKDICIEDGRYLHDGCSVRHRTQRAAENCTRRS